jgi:DNA-binding transcriptional MerR regulator
VADSFRQQYLQLANCVEQQQLQQQQQQQQLLQYGDYFLQKSHEVDLLQLPALLPALQNHQLQLEQQQQQLQHQQQQQLQQQVDVSVVVRPLRRRKRDSDSDKNALKRQNYTDEEDKGALAVDGSRVDKMPDFHSNLQIEECD